MVAVYQRPLWVYSLKSGALTSMRPEIEVLWERHSDPRRGQGLGVNQNIHWLKKPSVELNVKEPTWNEIQDVIQKAKASGAPGPSDIPYKVYKNCAEVVKDFEKDLVLILD